MWKATEARPLIEAAEKAAEAGNFASAENLLREAARLQEENLGPRHEDLANTLNNLGIVCEITGKPDDAEQYFRRAVSIARTSLPPDHPFVATSQKNLLDFCEARGTQVEPAPPVEAELVVEAEYVGESEAVGEPQAASQLVPVRRAPIDLDEDPEVTSRKFFTRVAFGALGPIAMLMVVLAAGLPRLGAPELAVSSLPTTVESPRDTAAAPAAATPSTTERPMTKADVIAGAVDEIPTDIAPLPAAGTSDSPSARPVVVRATLCGDLEDWSCDPADNPVPLGPLFFYTQIKSASLTTVQHRWYHDDRLLQTVELRVQPNREGGYRTYSRNVMKSDSAGNWRVEVRSLDGVLLDQERFTVR